MPDRTNENSRYLQGILDSSQNGIMAFVSIRDEQGTIIDFEWRMVNRMAEQMVQRTQAELLGKRLLVEMPGNRKEGLFDLYVQVVETGQPLDHEHYYEHENVKTWFHTTAYKLDDGFVVTFANISRSKNLQEELEKQYLELDHFFSVSLDLLCIASMDGRFLKLNPEWERVLGYTVSELEGQVFLDFVHPDDLQATMEAVATLDAQHPVMNFINRYRAKDGTYCVIEWRSFPYKDRIYAAARDITNRIQAQEQAFQLSMEQARTELLTNFIQNVTHEFRTPLSIITSNLYLINKIDDAETRKHKTQRIQEQVVRINDLVTLLMKMNKLDSDVPATWSKANINHLIESVLSNFVQDTPTITFIPQPGSDHLVVQAGFLKDAIYQVVHNAVRFTPSEGTITITTEQTEDSFIITVTDTGIGIAPDVMPRIFERFYRVDNAHSTPGFGLGLSLSQLVLAKHGGTITVDSTIGQGTRVQMIMPLQQHLTKSIRDTQQWSIS